MQKIEKEYNRAGAAAYLEKTISSLNTMATRQKHLLPFERIGNRVFYKKSDLDAYLDTKL